MLLDPTTTGDLFAGVGVLLETICLVKPNSSEYRQLQNVACIALQCLAEYSNVRITIFEDKQAKLTYIG